MVWDDSSKNWPRQFLGVAKHLYKALADFLCEVDIPEGNYDLLGLLGNPDYVPKKP